MKRSPKTVFPRIMILSLAVAMLSPMNLVARAQDAPQACVEGNLKDNYLGKECLLGNLTVGFDRDFNPAREVDPSTIQVLPTTSPSRLRFSFPTITPGEGGKTTLSFFSSVRGSGGALTSAVANAELGGKDVRVEIFVSELPKKDDRDFSILQLLNFVNQATGSFPNPGPKAVRVGYHLDVQEAAQPVIALTLTGG